MEEAFNIIEKQHLDFQLFNRPMEVINRTESKKILAQDSNWTPESEPAFSNPVNVGNEIIVYNVSDSMTGQITTRKAIDINWGYDRNPWCLAARDPNNEYDDELANAWIYWKKYSKYPKRIAFKNGKLLAFSVNDEIDLVWWDKNDRCHKPEDLGIDDSEFIKNDFLSIMRKIVHSSDYKGRNILARSKNTPTEILAELADDEVKVIRTYVAENENTLIWVLEKLAKEDGLKEYVVKNPKVPIRILEKLSDDESKWVKENICNNENTPAEILEKLSNDKYDIVRKAIAANKNTPVEILEKLSDDELKWVRCEIAKNKNTPIEILEKLSNDTERYVRYVLVKNENIPIEILKKLTNDNSRDVSQNAKLALKSRN